MSSPMNSSCVLNFHEAIELFLNLIIDANNLKTSNYRFMEYWCEVNKIPEKELGHKANMNSLNKSRNNLKHHGKFIAELDIEISRVNTRSFFLENTPKYFTLSFDEISLIEFVNPVSARNLLKKSQKFIAEESLEDAIINLSLSFAQIIEYHQDGYEIFLDSINQRLGNINGIFYHNNSSLENNHQLNTFLEGVEKSLSTIHSDLKIISFGLDYQNYAHFRNLSPEVYKISGQSNWHPQSLTNQQRINITPKNVEKCFNFVIDSALILSNNNPKNNYE